MPPAYVSKKPRECRQVERDRKSAKLWSKHNREFAWVSEGGTLRRKRVCELAEALGIVDYEEFQECYGPRWAYHAREQILHMKEDEWQKYLNTLKAITDAC